MEARQIVRYTGVQKPELAGMEGEVVSTSQEGEALFSQVAWKGRTNLPTFVLTHELKKLRGYSKRFR